MRYFTKSSALRFNFKGQIFSDIPEKLAPIEKLKAVIKNNDQMKRYTPENMFKINQQLKKSYNSVLGKGWDN